MSASLEQSRTAVLKAAADSSGPARGQGSRGPSKAATAEARGLLTSYFRLVATEDLIARDADELAAIALGHRAFAKERPVGTNIVRAFNPTMERRRLGLPHTVVQIVVDDMPFLVDSVVAALGGFDRGVHLIIHPQITVTRSVTGTMAGIAADDERTRRGVVGHVRESWMHLEIDRLPDASLPDVVARLHQVLENVRDAVEDWPKMRAHALTIATTLNRDGAPRHRPPPGARGGTVPRVAREQQLHLPRLPGVLPHA